MRSELRILFLAIALLTACTVTIFTWVITYLLDEASREITNNLEHAHIVQRAEQYLVDLNNEATQLARSFELSRSLLDTDLKKISTSFTAFMTSYEVGGDFTHALLIGEEGEMLAGYPRRAFEDSAIALENDVIDQWVFGTAQGIVYRCFTRSVLIARKPAKLLLYTPIDVAFLSRLGSASTSLSLDWRGTTVVRTHITSGGESMEPKLSRVSVPLDKDKTGNIKIIADLSFNSPVSPLGTVAIVLSCLVTFSLILWLTLGRWLSLTVLRIENMGIALETYGKHSFLTSEVNHFITQAVNRSFDEIASLGLSAQRLMRDLDSQKTKATQLAAIVENSSDIIFSCDLEGNILTWNGGAERLTGFSSAQVIGEKLSMALPSIHLASRQRKDEDRIRRGVEAVVSFEVEVTNKMDRRLALSGSKSQIKDHRGNVLAVAYVLQDRTELKLLEEARAELEMKAQKSQALSELTGGFAHHFNNMLGVVIGNVEEAIANLDNKEEVQGRLNRTEFFLNRAVNLVYQLMAFAQIAPLQRTLVAIENAVKAAALTFKDKLPPPLTLEVQTEGELIVRGDAGQIQQVLINLIQNAIDALAGRTGKVSVRSELVEINEVLATSRARLVQQIGEPFSLGARAVCLKVSDTGQGIDRQFLERIWEPFYTTRDLNAGVGLGLPVVLGIVKSHGGVILVESAAGEGSSFSVLLPLHDNGY